MLGAVQDIDLKLLRVFRAVARHGGFVAAQTELSSSLPTISNQIKQLEERLGVRLCERGNLGFRLTLQGEALLKSSDELFSALDGFRADVAEIARRPVGEVRLGIVDNLSTDPQCRIPEAIAAVQDRAPGAALRFFIGPPSDLESQVLGGGLDLAIGLFPAVPPALDALRLFEEEHALYCGRGHPFFARADSPPDPEALREAAYVSWAYQEAYVGDAEARTFSVQGATPFIEGLFYMVLSGRFIGYLPRHAAEKWVRDDRLRRIGGEGSVRRVPVTLISRRSQRPNRIAAAFRAELARAHGHAPAPESSA